MSDKPSLDRTALPVSCIAHIVQDGLSAAINVLLPVLAQAFGLGYAEVGILKGLKSLSQAVLEIYSGVLSESFGEHRVIMAGLALSAAGYALLSAAPGAFSLAGCLFVIGAGTALHHAPSSALVADRYANGPRSSALGIYNASGDVGKLVFAGGVSLAIGIGLAWYQVSFSYGLVAALATLLIAAIARSAARHRVASQTGKVADDRKPASGWGILNWPSYGALLIVTGLDTMVQSGIMVFIAFLMLSKGLPIAIATAATVILLTGGIFGKAACGFLAHRFGMRRAFTTIQILTALGLIAVTLAPAGIALALLLPLGAVAQGSSSITYGFAANLIHPRKMARGYALLYSSGSLAAAVGPMAIGLTADALGIETAIYAMALLTLLAVPPIFLLPARQERGEELVMNDPG